MYWCPQALLTAEEAFRRRFVFSTTVSFVLLITALVKNNTHFIYYVYLAIFAISYILGYILGYIYISPLPPPPPPSPTPPSSPPPRPLCGRPWAPRRRRRRPTRSQLPGPWSRAHGSHGLPMAWAWPMGNHRQPIGKINIVEYMYIYICV